MAAVVYTMADTAYERGYEDAIRDMEERELRRKQLRAERQNRRRRHKIAFIDLDDLIVSLLSDFIFERFTRYKVIDINYC